MNSSTFDAALSSGSYPVCREIPGAGSVREAGPEETRTPRFRPDMQSLPIRLRLVGDVEMCRPGRKHMTKSVTDKTASRRKFLKGGLMASGAVAATLAAPSVSRAEPVNLKMQAAWGGGIFLEDAKHYVDRVNAMAGKDLQIDLLSVGSVVKTSQMQDAVHRGVLDACHYVPAYWYSKSKAASLFGTGPCFGWSSQEVLGWLHFGGGQELFDELMASLGLNVVSFFNSPMPAQPLGWFKEQITDSSQMKGLKYRTVGLAADVMLEMGLSVVQLPGGEIQPAMKSGLIDAAEFNNPTSDRDFGMQDVSKHYHLASFHQSQEFFEVSFNKKKYDALPSELQAILKYASEAENSNFYWYSTKRYSDDLIKLRDEQGVNIYRTPDSVMIDQLTAWDKVIDRISSEDPFFAKVVASQKAYAKEVMNYLNLNQPDYKLAYKHYFG
jgi:TRAP-type mannitol/chloroaromatic compound transport system substrate-binding protein